MMMFKITRESTSTIVAALWLVCAAIPGADKQCESVDPNGNGVIPAYELTLIVSNINRFLSWTINGARVAHATRSNAAERESTAVDS